MDWLSEWIRQIILLVLIATFIDLLLPNPSFDRYVKLVMGLLIIMAILSPILSFLNKDFDLSSLTKWKTNQPVPTANMDSLNEIKGRSEQLGQFQTRQIAEEWEKNLEQIITKQLVKQFQLRDLEVTVKTQLQDGHTPQIQRIKVQARSGMTDSEVANQTSSGMKPIEPMAPIHVELEHHKPTKKQNPEQEKIQKYIEQTWHIPAKQIDVQIDTG